ncbi:MAG TPA: hypothetical protein VKL99_04760 [Candidatus Angelobacter sp.]|nr:hypothetical protein [Candidatus Angelobacter sp.]
MGDDEVRKSPAGDLQPIEQSAHFRNTAALGPASKQAPNHKPANLLLKFYKQINRPFWVTVVGGIIVLLITKQIDDRHWASQQRVLAAQAKLVQRLDSARKTQEQMAEEVGKVITSQALIIEAHERHFSKDDYNQIVDKHNLLKDGWDVAEDLLKLKMGLYYVSPDVRTQWNVVLTNLDRLDDKVFELQSKYLPTDRSPEHQKAIDSCKQYVIQIETGLHDLMSQMSVEISRMEAL